MKALDVGNFSISPLLFQLAARLELPALRRALRPALRARATTSPEASPGKTKAGAHLASGQRIPNTRPEKPGSEKLPERLVDDPEPRKTLFQLKAPAARSVKLVADFTDWERYPLDMIHCEEGNWFAIVPLAPGSYSYRFIVDGQWLNDPHAPQTSPNPFGSTNTILQVQ